jgi:hypothetical protein
MEATGIRPDSSFPHGGLMVVAGSGGDEHLSLPPGLQAERFPAWAVRARPLNGLLMHHLFERVAGFAVFGTARAVSQLQAIRRVTAWGGLLAGGVFGATPQAVAALTALGLPAAPWPRNGGVSSVPSTGCET